MIKLGQAGAAAKNSPISYHLKYYVVDGSCQCLVTNGNVMLKLPAGLLAARSKFFANVVKLQQNDPEVGRMDATAVLLKDGSIEDYEALLAYVMPMSILDQQSLSARTTRDLQSIIMLSETLGFTSEHRAAQRELTGRSIANDEQEMLDSQRPARTNHPDYFDRLHEGLVFCVSASNVLLRLPSPILAARSDIFAQMLSTAETAAGETGTVECPIFLHRGTIQDWVAFLQWIMPLRAEHQCHLETRGTHELLSILDLCDYLHMEPESALCATALDGRTGEISAAKKLWLADRYNIPQWRASAIDLLLYSSLCDLSLADIKCLTSFTCPPNSSTPFFTEYAMLFAKVTKNRLFFAEHFAELCPASQACITDDETRHEHTCRPHWEYLWRLNVAPMLLHPNRPISLHKALDEVYAEFFPNVHPDCVAGQRQRIMSSGIIDRPLGWIQALVKKM